METRTERDSVSGIQDRKEKTIVELGSGSIFYRGKGAAGQHTDRSSKKYSTRGGQAKRYQKNVQNIKKSMAEYQSRESGYT